MMKSNAWRTPFGLTLLIGSALSAIAGFFAGQQLQAPEQLAPPTSLENTAFERFDEDAYNAQNAEPPPEYASPPAYAPPPGEPASAGPAEVAPGDEDVSAVEAPASVSGEESENDVNELNLDGAEQTEDRIG